MSLHALRCIDQSSSWHSRSPTCSQAAFVKARAELNQLWTLYIVALTPGVDRASAPAATQVDPELRAALRHLSAAIPQLQAGQARGGAALATVREMLASMPAELSVRQERQLLAALRPLQLAAQAASDQGGRLEAMQRSLADSVAAGLDGLATRWSSCRRRWLPTRRT